MNGTPTISLAARLRDALALLAGLAGVGLPAYFAYAALGTKYGLHDWRTGLLELTIGLGPLLLLLGLILSLVALVLAFLIKPRRGWRLALVGLLTPLIGLGYMTFVRSQAGGVPPIHDISTDLADPPGFSEAVVSARAGVACHNGLDLLTKRVGENADPACRRPGASEPGPAVIDLHREHYTDITPIIAPIAPEGAYDVALEAACGLGWAIGLEDRAGGRLEATETSFWFGFVDDVAVRVRPGADGGAVIDVRSVSRVGISDLGANAARIRAFRARVEGTLAALAS